MNERYAHFQQVARAAGYDVEWDDFYEDYRWVSPEGSIAEQGFDEEDGAWENCVEVNDLA